MENGINEREVYSENYEKDKEAIKRQCTFLSENSNLFYRYLDELLDLTTGLPMYQAEYPEEKFFAGRILSTICFFLFWIPCRNAE